MSCEVKIREQRPSGEKNRNEMEGRKQDKSEKDCRVMEQIQIVINPTSEINTDGKKVY